MNWEIIGALTAGLLIWLTVLSAICIGNMCNNNFIADFFNRRKKLPVKTEEDLAVDMSILDNNIPHYKGYVDRCPACGTKAWCDDPKFVSKPVPHMQFHCCFGSIKAGCHFKWTSDTRDSAKYSLMVTHGITKLKEELALLKEENSALKIENARLSKPVLGESEGYRLAASKKER